jgi:F-type H+-transporting ATPase subunit b
MASSVMEHYSCTTIFRKLFLFGMATVCIAWLLAPSARAQEPPCGSKYRVTYLKGSEEHEKDFDLSIPEEKDEFNRLVNEGLIQKVEHNEPPKILDLRWDLGLWTIVVFLLLLWILGKYAWKPMLEGLQKREDTIRGHLEEARRANEDAKKLRSQLQQEMDQAAEKVRELVEEGRRGAETAKEEILARTRSEIQAERERLHREVDLARDQALQEIWRQAADLATLISAKTIRRQLNPEDHRRLVDEAISEIRTASGVHAS